MTESRKPNVAIVDIRMPPGHGDDSLGAVARTRVADRSQALTRTERGNAGPAAPGRRALAAPHPVPARVLVVAYTRALPTTPM
jgi:hypothetical protein